MLLKSEKVKYAIPQEVSLGCTSPFLEPLNLWVDLQSLTHGPCDTRCAIAYLAKALLLPLGQYSFPFLLRVGG